MPQIFHMLDASSEHAAHVQQMLHRKEAFIEQIMSGVPDQRTEDVTPEPDTSYATIKALATDPALLAEQRDGRAIRPDKPELEPVMPDGRPVRDAAMLRNAKRVVLHHLPSAVSMDLAASDQNLYGFVLTGVTLADGTEADLPDELCNDIVDHLSDLDWNGVVGEDDHGYATVDLTDAAAVFAVARERLAVTPV